MVLSYQIHHLDKRNCKKKSAPIKHWVGKVISTRVRCYPVVWKSGEESLIVRLEMTMTITTQMIIIMTMFNCSPVGWNIDNYDNNEDDHHNDNVHLLPPSARTLIPLLCRLSFSRLLLRLLVMTMITIMTVIEIKIMRMMTLIVMITMMMSYSILAMLIDPLWYQQVGRGTWLVLYTIFRLTFHDKLVLWLELGGTGDHGSRSTDCGTRSLLSLCFAPEQRVSVCFDNSYGVSTTIHIQNIRTHKRSKEKSRLGWDSWCSPSWHNSPTPSSTSPSSLSSSSS